jgi:hypothetical protein
MPEIPVVTIETLDHLKKVLFVQRTITRRAHDELEAVASDNLLDADPEPSQVKKYMKEEAALLASYAMRPTLTEWAVQGGLEQGGFYEGATTWGASFGVAILANELILEQIRHAHPPLGAAVKGVFLSVLAAEVQLRTHLDEGELERMVMKFNVTKQDGTPIEDETVAEKIRASLADMVQTIIATGLEYGLFAESLDSGAHRITEVGTRVMLHMHDILKFVAIMAEAHQRFQSEAPALMNSLADPPPSPRRKRRITPKKPIT